MRWKGITLLGPGACSRFWCRNGAHQEVAQAERVKDSCNSAMSIVDGCAVNVSSAPSPSIYTQMVLASPVAPYFFGGGLLFFGGGG